MQRHFDCANRLGVAAILLLLSLLAALPAQAQSWPRWELFTGFSYARLSLSGQSVFFQPTDPNYYGAHFTASYNPKRYLRVLLCDWGVQMGQTAVDLSPLRTDLRTSQILFGPEFTGRGAKSTVFAHTLIGVTNTRLVSSIDGADIVPDLAGRTNLAFGVGGGLDLRLTRRITLRPAQADYIPTRLSGTWISQFRTSSGVVFTWGHPQPR